MTEEQLFNRRQKQLAFKYANAKHISEAFPNVQSITIRYTGIPNSAFSKVKSDEQRYTPDMQDVFLVECPNGTCTGIGFDMYSVVSKAIRNHKTEQRGVMECENFEDAERYNQYHCGSKLEYTILVEYRS